MHHRLYFFFLLFLTSHLNGQFLFEGVAPEAYRGKTVHLDVIDGWNDFRLIAEDQLLAETRVDSSGRFRFEGNGLPAARGFYRLRFRDQEAQPEVSMWYRNRHFIHFVARANDTLSFRELSLLKAGATNAKIDQAAGQFDRFDQELRSAESDRLTELIEEKRERYIRSNLTENDAATNIFLLGHWPDFDDAPLPLLESLEGLLLADKSMRPEYLTTLRQQVGAASLDKNRREIFLLRILLLLAGAGILLLIWLFWRERRSKVAVKEPGKTTSLAVTLSPKEEEVLAGIVGGESNKAIAARLFVSEATVKSHINSIYKKAGIGKRQEAIAFGRERGCEVTIDLQEPTD